MFLVSLGFSGSVAATLGHQHYNPEGLPIGHGFVHGQSNTDGSFHSRVEPGGAPRTCQIDTVNKPEGYKTLVYGDFTTTCNIWSLEIFQSATECRYRADTDPAQYALMHVHRPVNYCG